MQRPLFRRASETGPSLRPVPPPVPFLEPELPSLSSLAEDLSRIYENGVFSNGGPYERALSRRLAHYLGVRHALPVANATLGLMLAARAVALPAPRRKVLLPSFTFAATALAAEWAGLEPVFCDVDPETWQAAARAEDLGALAGELALLLPCNSFGAPADVAAWRALSRELEVPVVFDSAAGVGATYADGRRQGTSGFVEVFSLHATKPFAVGEGGVVTTDDDAVAARIASWRNFAFDAERRCTGPGLNAKMPEVLAAIGCRALDRHEQVIARRRERARLYRERLAPHGVLFQKHGERSTYQFFPACLPEGHDAADLSAFLAARHVETRHYFRPPLHQHPHFADRARVGRLAVTESLSRRVIALPMANRLREETVARICDAVAEFLR